MAKPQASTNLKSIGALSGEVGGSQSEEDIRMALRRLRKGASPEHMVESLAEQALARGKRKTRPAAESYARLTVEKALLYLSKGR